MHRLVLSRLKSQTTSIEPTDSSALFIVSLSKVTHFSIGNKVGVPAVLLTSDAQRRIKSIDQRRTGPSPSPGYGLSMTRRLKIALRKKRNPSVPTLAKLSDAAVK
jgi:hypothetical protein